MSDRIKYALNTVSGVVSKVDADLLNHPTFGADLVEVDEPGVCIPCGAQPTEVTTVQGEHIVLSEPEVSAKLDFSAEPEVSVDPAPSPRSKTKTRPKEAK